MKLWVNLKSAILRWSAVIPNGIIGDPSAVFHLVVVGCIGVSKLSSINWYVEYLMRDIAVPESLRSLQHFPACLVIVGQSIINATVACSCVGGPVCSWESLLGEGSFSLNDLSPLLSHWNVHQCCNSLGVDLLFSLSGFLGVWFASWFAGMWMWSVQVLPWDFVGWAWMQSTMISGVVSWRTSMSGCSVMRLMWCHSRINGCNLYMWSMSIVSYSLAGCDYPYVMTWSGLCKNHDNLSGNACKNEIMVWNDFACPILMVVPQTWSGMMASVRSGLVVFCWGSWRRYPVWAIHHNVTILITLKASIC